MAIIHAPSPNFGARRDGVVVDMLIIHYTEMRSADAALNLLRDPKAAVSAHYLVARNGQVYQLVDEDARAWHAGVSYWSGDRDINSRSIGIELDHPGHAGGNPPFERPLMAALGDLADGILARHKIPAHHVLGHSDIAIERKIDPGEQFDWAYLARRGIGLWPEIDQLDQADHTPYDPAVFGQDLARFGYDHTAPQAVAAFQRHFRPALINNHPDRECAAILAALLAQTV
jgi:N-acetylmuramoyl-L-alanine amidase